MSKKHIHVAVGIVMRDDKVFLTRRAQEAHQGGKWEFPGGKVEGSESWFEALYRELEEEIGIQMFGATLYACIEHDYPERKVTLDFAYVSEFEGTPTGCEGQESNWFSVAELLTLDFPEANQPVLKKLAQQFVEEA